MKGKLFVDSHVGGIWFLEEGVLMYVPMDKDGIADLEDTQQVEDLSDADADNALAVLKGNAS